MDNYVPIEKRSKKNKKEVNELKRKTWTVDSRTKVIKNKKAYTRHHFSPEEAENIEEEENI